MEKAATGQIMALDGTVLKHSLVFVQMLSPNGRSQMTLQGARGGQEVHSSRHWKWMNYVLCSFHYTGNH